MALHRRRIAADVWTPVRVDALEANALDVVRSVDNRSVIAGPGAGKTELLAQRAAYLLQTGGSTRPQRILAISFKRDAATNLGARVRKRCRPEHAARLDSMTFDAFAKGIVDRFGQALPAGWRPQPDYQIFFPTERMYRDFLNTVGTPPAEVGTRAHIEAIHAKTFERKHLFGTQLPTEQVAPASAAQWAAGRYWETSLRGPRGSFLSFPMIGRLAELVLRVNPLARQALSLTYSHLFLDEFQDTTQIQYDLVKTIFLGSSTVVTAVGDKSPELVRIQHILAQALDAEAVEPVSKAEGAVSGDSCAVWDFSSPEVEAERLAAFIVSEMKTHGLGPRDFVLLVRQEARKYVPLLADVLAIHDIILRNEAAEIGPVKLQELLSEELSELVISLIRLATSERGGPGATA